MSGLWTLIFEDGSSAHIESGFGVRSLAACFGATEGTGDLMEKIEGEEIVFGVDDFGIVEWFIPSEHWGGPDTDGLNAESER
jgi:hypothetical protein